jgi:DedD protein
MATEKLSEQEIQLRKRARRRLVGAIALVLLMVTVLPMVLDDREAQTPQPEIAVNIPSQDGNDFASRIVPVEPGAESAPQPNQSPDTPVESPLPQPEPAPTPIPTPAPVPEPKAEPAPQPEAPVVPEPRAEAPVAAPAKPAAPVKQAMTNDGFTVQIGVFSDAANVKQLQSKLEASGFKSYTEKLGMPGGTKFRLRVGSYATRAEAEKARDKLKAAGTTGIVVAK